MKTITIPVPDWAEWWTVDENGSVWVWQNRPRKGSDRWIGEWAGMQVAVTQNPTDWTKELHRIK